VTAGIEGVTVPPWRRLWERVAARSVVAEAAALSLAAAIFLASVLPNLANHPTLTDDEAWVMSASFKLARSGVFGSDMFRDFYHADSHYFFNMPGHHFAVALAFKLLGAGVLQARLVGVLYGLATLGLTYLLARRLYGVVVAVLALALLLFLRLNMGFDTGLPLQELAANIRYDLAPVPFILGGLLILLGPRGGTASEDGTPTQAAAVVGFVTPARAALAGLLFGIATLMQFYGAFAIPGAGAFIWFEAKPPRERLKAAGALVGVAAIVGVPYGAFVLAYFDDFRGQAGTVDRRDDFARPSFYADSLAHEPDRFLRPLGFKEVPKGEDPRLVDPRFLSLREMAVRRPSAKLAVLVGLPLALLYSGWRALKLRSRGDRLLFTALAGLIVEYALFESLKLYIYWIPVVPLLCIGIAAVSLELLRGMSSGASSNTRGPSDVFGFVSPRLRWGLGLLAALALLGFFAEGAAARVSGWRTAGDETDYATLGRLIHENVPPGSKVVGSTSLWWAMRDTDYRSYFMFFYVTSPHAGPYRDTISGFLDEVKPQYLVLTRLGQEELDKHLSDADRRDLEAYKEAHGQLVKRLEAADARSYGYVEIWRLQ
jgi:4-amino-4-deoxy-L-arabinose transferase-like glycosyltransferase